MTSKMDAVSRSRFPRRPKRCGIAKTSQPAGPKSRTISTGRYMPMHHVHEQATNAAQPRASVRDEIVGADVNTGLDFEGLGLSIYWRAVVLDRLFGCAGADEDVRPPEHSQAHCGPY